MADFAGALTAIKAKFEDEWVIGPDPRTRITVVNKNPEEPWPPKDSDKKLLPWVLFAATGSASSWAAGGIPGNQLYLYSGLIEITVYVPVGDGTEGAFGLAIIAGEIFRNQVFYDDVTPGSYIRSMAPRVDGGAPGDDDGAWFRVTAAIPFEYYHRG